MLQTDAERRAGCAPVAFRVGAKEKADAKKTEPDGYAVISGRGSRETGIRKAVLTASKESKLRGQFERFRFAGKTRAQAARTGQGVLSGQLALISS